MKHSHKKETREKVDTLLRQYKEYKKAPTKAEKDRIGDEMTYADPIVWMMYKHEAYKGGDHEITTLGDLKKHSIDHGGICAKRFGFLRKAVEVRYCKDILDSEQFPCTMSLMDFYDSDIVNEIVSDQAFIKEWEHYEYYKEGQQVAKWQNYFA